MPIDTHGLATIATSLDTTVLDHLLTGALEQDAHDLIEHVGEVILQLAEDWAPEDKHRLKDSLVRGAEENIFEWISFLELNVGTMTPYAVFQEYGTRHHAAQPFLTPAVEEVRPYWAEQIGNLFSGEADIVSGISQVGETFGAIGI